MLICSKQISYIYIYGNYANYNKFPIRFYSSFRYKKITKNEMKITDRNDSYFCAIIIFSFQYLLHFKILFLKKKRNKTFLLFFYKYNSMRIKK